MNMRASTIYSNHPGGNLVHKHTPVYRRVCETREKKKRLSPVSLSVFSLVPDLLFDCSRLLEYARIRTVLQSRRGGRTTLYKVYPNQLNKLKREENFVTSKPNPHFLKLSLRDGANHLIFQLEFPVFPCNW